MVRRLNITLPEETVRLIDRAAKKGNRSRFIDEAVKHFITTARRTALRKQLQQGALRRASRDLALAEDWFPLEDELWHKGRG